MAMGSFGSVYGWDYRSSGGCLETNCRLQRLGADPSSCEHNLNCQWCGVFLCLRRSAQDPAVGNFAAFVLALWWPTIVFTIPVAWVAIEKRWPSAGSRNPIRFGNCSDWPPEDFSHQATFGTWLSILSWLSLYLLWLQIAFGTPMPWLKVLEVFGSDYCYLGTLGLALVQRSFDWCTNGSSASIQSRARHWRLSKLSERLP